MIPDLEIRPERSADLVAVHDLVRDAFGREYEAIVVERLRASTDYLPGLSLVALRDGRIVGHIMITRQEISLETGKPVPSTILAPLAVATDVQRQGIGEALTWEALDRARAAGHRSMLLVGHPWYYPRFGFQPASTWGIRYASPIPDEVFMAIELESGALTNSAGTVALSAAFDEA